MKPGAFSSQAWKSAAQVENAQRWLLTAHAGYCAQNSPYYRTVFAAADINPGDITPATLAHLPATDKATFTQRNADFLAVPQEQIVDVVLSSGTTGEATSVMYTERDLQRLAHNEALSFTACGVDSGDVALLTCTMDRCFVAGLAYQLGLRQLGAVVIRNGAATLESHANLIHRFNPTVLVGVPTFLRKLALFLKENGSNPAATTVERLVCIGEPLRDADMEPLRLGSDLELLWDAGAYSTYASSEIVSSFCECSARHGGHLLPELAIVEIVDDDGNVLAPGEHGEVVVTPLQVEGMPLLRFKTGDVSFLITEPCACGRITPRLGPILGRKSQMMKFRGTTLYPQSLFAVLGGIPAVTEFYVVATSEDRLADRISVHAAVSDNTCSAEWIAERLQSRLRVKPDVFIEPEKTVAKKVFASGSRKAVRFIDRRNKRL
jgi:phenylacetate-CoA ligase